MNSEELTFYVVAIIALLVTVIYTRDGVIEAAAIAHQELIRQERAQLQEQLNLEIERNSVLELLNSQLQTENQRLSERNRRQKQYHQKECSVCAEAVNKAQKDTHGSVGQEK